MKFRDANLQVHEKSSFAHPPSYILPSLSKNTSRLLLPKSLWKCATKISFSCSITIPPSQLSSCRRCSWTFSWVQFLSNKLKLICFLRCKITRISFFFCLCSVFWHLLFWHLYQIHTFINNLNDEEIILQKSIEVCWGKLKRFWIGLLLNFTIVMT